LAKFTNSEDNIRSFDWQIAKMRIIDVNGIVGNGNNHKTELRTLILSYAGQLVKA